MEEYGRLESEKLVKINKHPHLPIYNINYTPRANFKKGKWSSELLIARGLVVDEYGTIIGRPIPKFFNDYEVTPPNGGYGDYGDFEVTEKMDGSLIIMSFYRGGVIFSTRGSFTSEQAVKAKEIYEEKYSDIEIDVEFTYCFEVIYPKNRIVVDYGGEEDLILLAKINTKTGEEVDDVCFRQVVKYDLTYSEMKAMDLENKEGFVVRFMKDNYRIKVKFESYIFLHKNRTISRDQILKQMKKDEFDVPDECLGDAKEIVSNLKKEYRNIEDEIIEHYANLGEENIFEKIQIMFAMHKGKKYKKLIWNLIKK